MNKQEFRKKIRKGIAEYYADPVIQKRLKIRNAKKRRDKLKNND